MVGCITYLVAVACFVSVAWVMALMLDRGDWQTPALAVLITVGILALMADLEHRVSERQ